MAGLCAAHLGVTAVAIVVTQEGAAALIQWALQLAAPQQPVAHLLGSPHALAHADTETVLQASELSVRGYSPIALANPALNWVLSSFADGRQATYSVVTWGLLDACTIYGYWLATGDGLTSLWGETLATPVVFPSGGGPWSLIPYFYLSSQPFTQGECG
jgi:hypothetical protein